jgi:hypothetical protein
VGVGGAFVGGCYAGVGRCLLVGVCVFEDSWEMSV